MLMKALFTATVLVLTIAAPAWAGADYDKAYADGKTLAECAGSLRAMSESRELANFPKMMEQANNKANLWELAAMFFIASNGRLDSEEVAKYISKSAQTSWGATFEVEGLSSYNAYWDANCARWQGGVDSLADEMRKNPPAKVEGLP
jgi:hypothetical protein